MSIFKNILGTSESRFRIGLKGPTFYFGSANPTSVPPTPIADGFRDGDIYVRTLSGSEAIWVRQSGTFTEIATGATGGSFDGDITMNPGAQFLGDETASALAPAYSFDGDDDTGIFQNNPDEISFATSGVERFIIESDGTLASTTAGYESLVTSDNDIPNRKYVEDTFINAAGDSLTGDLTFSGTAQLLLQNGTLTDPVITFSDDPNSGVIWGGSQGQTTFVSDGVRIGTFNNDGLRMDGGHQFIADTTTASVPGYSFSADLDTGLFSDGTGGEFAFSSNGTETIRFGGISASGTLLWRGGDGSATTPALSFSADNDTGFFRSGTGTIEYSSNGTSVLTLDGVAVDSSLFWRGPAGSTITPSISFSSDSDTGFFNSAPGNIRVSNNNRDSWEFLPDTLLPITNNLNTIGSSSLRIDTVFATTFDGTATSAQYSDLAERYSVGDCILEPGDVVVICEHEEHDVCLSTKAFDERVLGVVSKNPAFMMNSEAGDDTTAPYIALRGRVLVKVYGTVKKGDLLVTCGMTGCARAINKKEKESTTPHAVFAKALSQNDQNGLCEAVIL